MNPYKVLDVAPDATETDIRAAYVRLAKTCHPDLHPDDPDAEERFKRLSAAKDLLFDPAERERFDRAQAAQSPARGPRPYTPPTARAARPAPATPATPADRAEAARAFGALFFGLFGPIPTSRAHAAAP